MKLKKILPQAVFSLFLASLSVAHSATIDWSATAATSGWATGSNWVGGTAPVSDLTTDIARFDQSSYLSPPNAPSGRQISGITFGNNSTSTPAITLTTATNQSRLQIGSAGISIGSQSGAVSIGGASTSSGLQLGTSQSWANNSSALLSVVTLSGATVGQDYVLTFDGSGSGGTTITGIILNSYDSPTTGSLSLVINTTGGGVTTLTNSGNTFSGSTTLTSGVLALGSATSMQRSLLNTTGSGTLSLSTATVTLGGMSGSRNISSVITSGYGAVTTLNLAPYLSTTTATYSGVISNGAATTGLTKVGAGTQILEGANTFTGATNINAGILGVTSLGNVSVANSLGQSAVTAANLTINGGTLQLTGSVTSAQSTDRLFAVGVTGATIDSSAGAGSSMNFTNTGTITGVNSVGARTLTLTGSRDGSISSIIGQRNGTDSTTSIVKTGNGTWTLSGANTYTGTTTVSGGTLLINGSVGSGGVTVSNGGTLGGTGTVSGLVAVNSGGTLSPGNSPGIAIYSGGLTLETGSNFTFELIANTTAGRGTNFDGVNVTGGTFTLQSGVNFNLTFNSPGSSTDFTSAFWDAEQSWLVFSNANSPSIASMFNIGSISTDSLSNSFGVTGGEFSFVQTGNDLYLRYAVIPEPSTWILVAIGLTAVVLRRRRTS